MGDFNLHRDNGESDHKYEEIAWNCVGTRAFVCAGHQSDNAPA